VGIDEWVMTSDVLSAMSQLLPVFLIAAVIDQAAAWRDWSSVDEMTPGQRRASIFSVVWFALGILFVGFIEIVVLAALNDGGAKGALAASLWFAVPTWMAVFTLSLLANAVPRLGRRKTAPKQ